MNLNLDPWMLLEVLLPFCRKKEVGRFAQTSKFFKKGSKNLLTQIQLQEEQENIEYWANGKQVIKTAGLRNIRNKAVYRTALKARKKMRSAFFRDRNLHFPSTYL